MGFHRGVHQVIQYSWTWVDILRRSEDANDTEIRRAFNYHRPDDEAWWYSNQDKIEFVFKVFQDLGLGYYEKIHGEEVYPGYVKFRVTKAAANVMK